MGHIICHDIMQVSQDTSWYNTIVKERGEAEPFFNGRN